LGDFFTKSLGHPGGTRRDLLKADLNKQRKLIRPAKKIEKIPNCPFFRKTDPFLIIV
jgi:hypothetical protein